jgi:hypothetical protein
MINMIAALAIMTTPTTISSPKALPTEIASQETLPNAHQIGQVLSELYVFIYAYIKPPNKTYSRPLKYAMVRNVRCQSKALPKLSPDEVADMVAAGSHGPGQTVAAAECQYESLKFTPYFDKSDSYKGPRQIQPYRMNASEQKKLSRKTWKSEKRIFYMLERGPCYRMRMEDVAVPNGFDCGNDWFMPDIPENSFL